MASGSVRWGSFVLSSNPGAEERVAEEPALRADFPWAEGESPWSHRYGVKFDSWVEAANDQRVPLPEWSPPEEGFLTAVVIEDGRGPADGLVAFLRRDHPDVSRYARLGAPTGDDRTLAVMWTARTTQPAYMPYDPAGPIPLNALTVDAATAVCDETRLIRVKGTEAIARLWSPRNGQTMYGARLPTVILNWFEGRILWSVQSSFLSVEDAVKVAESIRPTTVPS